MLSTILFISMQHYFQDNYEITTHFWVCIFQCEFGAEVDRALQKAQVADMEKGDEAKVEMLRTQDVYRSIDL